MDFEYAANRLKKDHAELRKKGKKNLTLASNKATLEARKRQEYRQRQLEKKKEKERVEKLKLDHVRRRFDILEHKLGVMRNLMSTASSSPSPSLSQEAQNNIGSSSPSFSLLLDATSVHGQGDKITLPPSLLSILADKDLLRSSQERGQPLFFRLGIRRPNYVFPESEQMKKFMNEYAVKSSNTSSSTTRNSTFTEEVQDAKMSSLGTDLVSSDSATMKDNASLEKVNGENDNDDDADSIDDDDDEQEQQLKWEQAYLEELAHEYISYVYATVIEFTQDEGCIGLPKCIATALLQQKLEKATDIANHNNSNSESMPSLIETKFTIDPASASNPKPMDIDSDNDESTTNLTPNEAANIGQNNDDMDLESKTPGHPAYGLFPIPKNTIEVTLLTHLPPGKKCTLQPTKNAIQNGFYNLKDIKIVLEQSLIRTRGCLNVNDIVHCWHRGKKFDLRVKDVTPSYVGAVSCVNTDVEVDIAAAEEEEEEATNIVGTGDNSSSSSQQGQSQQSIGYRLSDDRPTTINNNTPTSTGNNNKDEMSSSSTTSQFYQELKKADLPNEPPLNQTENIITVQIRGDKGGKQCRRRFDITSSKIKDLFILAVHEDVVELNDNDSSSSFRLVTRFPRRIFKFESDGDKMLEQASLSKQELFMIEKM